MWGVKALQPDEIVAWVDFLSKRIIYGHGYNVIIPRWLSVFQDETLLFQEGEGLFCIDVS
jgi:hypothetical protein